METRKADKAKHPDAGTWIRTGIVGGIIAGTAMAMVAMIWMMLAGTGFWKPMDLIASILLGKGAIAGGFQIGPELLGMMIHLMLSAGFVFAFFAFFVSRTSWSSGAIVGTALTYGLLLWIVNVVIIDTLFIPAGLSLAPTLVLIVVYLVFGLVLGLVLGLVAAPKLSKES